VLVPIRPGRLSEDHDRIAAKLLAADGWNRVVEEDEDRYTGYEQGTVPLEPAFVARDESGTSR
jgi:hypothetical protein